MPIRPQNRFFYPIDWVQLSEATRTVPYKHSRIAYRRRNRIERLFGHLKNWRRVATRYDRLACNYLAAVAIVSCVVAWT